ncbi:MAG TPA: hypothetical protein VN962_12680 [Polyangia bacterium]|nr:hypothetical protein [Polyangia bacterium]
MTTRIFTALIGMWLFVSAFMWPHSQSVGALTIICAVLTFLLAIGSFYSLFSRYANLAVAAVLFVGTLALPSVTRATVWNNVIVAVAILAAALIDRGPEGVRRERELYGRV